MRITESASSSWLLRILSCAGCGILALWGFAMLLGTMILPHRLVGQSASCQNNLHYVTRAFRLYADDYDDVYPPGQTWNAAVLPYLDLPVRLRCPTVSSENGKGYGYAMNTAAAGKPRLKIEEPGKLPLVYDSSNLAPNALDAFSSLPRPGRHRGRQRRGESLTPSNNVGYADGSVRMRFDPLPSAGPGR